MITGASFLTASWCSAASSGATINPCASATCQASSTVIGGSGSLSPAKQLTRGRGRIPYHGGMSGLPDRGGGGPPQNTPPLINTQTRAAATAASGACSGTNSPVPPPLMEARQKARLQPP